LSREKVLDAALALADAQGLGKLSMRKIAGELGVEAMSLYNHVKNKGDLLDGIAARVFESVPLPDPALPWDERLRVLGNAAFAAFNEHPVVVRALAGEQANPLSPGTLPIIDAILGALMEAGLDEYHAGRAYRSLLGMVFGAVLLDSSGLTGEGDRNTSAVAWFRRTVTAEEHPHLHRALPALVEIDCVQDFQYQLELLINGLQNLRGDCGGS
jgi:TetR/AcrR family transcriptional regulator, tetracycline repressor protein